MRGARRSLLLAAAAACLPACGIGADSGPDGGGGDNDGGVECTAFISFDPPAPTASTSRPVRVNATVLGARAVLDYAWSVSFKGASVATMSAQPDGSAITFPAILPGVYSVRLQLGGTSGCPTVQEQLNVRAVGARQERMRLRITPPASAGVPPTETLVDVYGGAEFTLHTISLDRGRATAATVQGGAAGVPAYLRLMPVTGRAAAVEAYTDGAGGFAARVLDQPHDVLVVPTAPDRAPQLVRDWSPAGPDLPVVAGAAVGGTVTGPGGPLAGAKVQLKVLARLQLGGQLETVEIPSTIATTDAAGAFSLRAEPVQGAEIEVDVTPPDGSGLPRLLAQAPFAASLQIAYAASPAPRNLQGTIVQRQGGTPVAGAKVVVVGSQAAAGTVTPAGGSPVSAVGMVRVAGATSGAGALPVMRVPPWQLSAVVELTPSDHPVAAIDLTSGTPASMTVNPATSKPTQLQRPGGAAIDGAVLDAIPAGDLAQAGVASAIRARADAGGQLSVSLSDGARYDLRIHDPIFGRGAPRVVAGVTSATIAAGYALRPALTATGKLALAGSPAPLAGASIQVLCITCPGLERSRPLAEATSRADGSFTLVVPDPGTN